MPRIVHLLSTCLLVLFASLNAFSQLPPGQPPKLTAVQQEKLKLRDRYLAEAIALQSEGKLADARVKAEKSLAITQEVFGDNPGEAIAPLEWLIDVCLQAEDFAAAREYAKKALAHRITLHGESHWITTNARRKLAGVDLHSKLSKKQRAELHEADQLMLEARGRYDRGEYQRAQKAAEKALALRGAILGEKNYDYATNLNNLAFLYNSLCLYAKAEPAYRQAAAIYKEVIGEKHPDYATNINNLALLYDVQGLFEKAEPLYKQSLSITKETLGDRHTNYALTLNNLASVYQSLGLFAKAEPLFLEALSIYKDSFGDKHPDYASSLNNLASFYDARGLIAKAEPLYREVLVIRKEVLGLKHPDYASSLSNLAALYYSKGLFAKSAPIYQDAIKIFKEALGEKHPDYALALHGLANAYSAQGLSKQATPLYQDAIGIIEEQLETTAAIQSESGQLVYLSANRSYLDSFLGLAGTDPADIYKITLRWRGAVTARQAFARAHVRALSNTSSKSQVNNIVEELRDVSQQLAILVSNPLKPGDDTNLSKLHDELDDKRQKLEIRLVNESKDFAKYLEYRKLSPRDLQKQLPPDSALIDFLAYGDKIAAFVVTPKTIVRVDLKGTQELPEMVQGFRSHLSLKRTRPEQGGDDDSILYKTVWEPLLPYLGDAKLILICPDGPLCQLPFAALRGKDSKKYLIEEVAIAVIPVPRMLPELLAKDTTKTNSESSLLAIGDVDFGPGRPWDPLAGTKSEIETIEKLFRQGKPNAAFKSLTRGNATQATIRNVAGNYRFLHFATHGFFDAPIPHPKVEGRGAVSIGRQNRMPVLNQNLLCGLVCAGANKPKLDDDGRLTALEIMDLDLSGVELAVLSACETGLGKIEQGDGVMGLQRAFQLAGVRTTVTSLWKVPDAATSSLMIRFYENKLMKSMPTLEALREAQLWVLNNGVKAGILAEEPKNGRRTPPLYWAAFTLAGDWR